MEARSSSLKKRARDSSVDELKPSPTVIKCFSDLVPLIKTLREDDDESCFKSTNTESIPKSATFSESFLPSCRFSVDESIIDIDTQQVEFLEDGWVDKLLSSIFQEDCLSDDFHCMDREDIPPTTIEGVKEINKIDSQVPVSESFSLHHDGDCSLQVALRNKIGKARAGSTASISNQKTKMGEAEKDMSMHRTNMTTPDSSHSAQTSSTNETGAGQVQICVPHHAAMFASFSPFPVQHLPSVQQCDVLTPETRERIALWHFFELAERMDVPMILTLTSFPFRVVHVNRAFYTSNTFQQAMVTDIIGEGIFTMISRQYPSLPSPTLTTMPTLLALFDEDEIVQVSLAGKSGKKQTTSCKVNVRGVGRGIIQNSQDFLGTRTFLRGSCLRYFAVNLTPHFPVPSRNAAMKS